MDGVTRHEPGNFASESGLLRTTLASESVSECRDFFGHEAFEIKRVKPGYPDGCPVIGCATQLVKIPYGKRSERLFCSQHGIRLHTDTFVYWNGATKVARNTASLRNFRIRPELLSEIAIDPKQKAESHRLGSEMAEDALSWNVFVALAQAKKLRAAVQFLIGRNVESEPSLYLWGRLIDITRPRSERFKPLDDVRERLEKGIGKFKTEPDIMLVVDSTLVICIEAKFGSGNPLARESAVRAGDKPTDREGLLSRYLDAAGTTTRDFIDKKLIGSVFHSQLFRNVIFASEMATGGDWHVVNLASKTQWDNEIQSKHSHADPADRVRQYLRKDVRDRFTYRTWEGLHKSLVAPDAQLIVLDGYMRSKSAHFRRAFALS